MNENEHLPYKQERIDATEKTLKKMVAISAKLHHSSLKSLTLMYSVNRRESGRHFHIDSDDKKIQF